MGFSSRLAAMVPLGLAIALLGCGPSTPPAEEASSVDPTPAEPDVPSAGADREREIADAAAREELARVEAERRAEDPAVRLPIEDYEVTVLEQPEFVVYTYRYANESPPFTPWDGHGMHFSIQVDRATGETRLLRGR